MCPTLRVSGPDWKIKVGTVIADEEIAATIQLFMEDVPAQVCCGSAASAYPHIACSVTFSLFVTPGTWIQAVWHACAVCLNMRLSLFMCFRW